MDSEQDRFNRLVAAMSKEDLEWLIQFAVETGLRCQFAANVRSSVTSKKQTDQKVGREVSEVAATAAFAEAKASMEDATGEKVR